MKILILQLARLGDIYMTWPIVRALRQKYSSAQIDLLVRPRFAVACEGLEAVDHVRLFPTQDFLSPLMVQGNLQQSLGVVDNFINQLREQKYDRIINLSFSEVSSYVVSLVADPKTEISGYSRHQDGYLNLTDDISRYFWAQVGPGGFNQIHLLDLLAGTAGVELSPECFAEPLFDISKTLEMPYVAVHIGGSETHKRIPAKLWIYVIENILQKNEHTHIALIGGEGDRTLASQITEKVSNRVHDFVGKTQLKDVFGIIKHSQGVIGGDSMAMHLLPFVNQRGLCLSRGDVNPFETGPITNSSWIFRCNEDGEWDLNAMDQVLKQWLERGVAPICRGLMISGNTFPRVIESNQKRTFPWNLIQAIYMNAPFPMAEDIHFYRGCLRMFEANHVALQNLEKYQKIKPQFLTALLDRVDEIHAKIAAETPDIYPLFRWYQAEKTRVQPGSYKEMVEDYQVIIEHFQKLLRQYLLEEDVKKAQAHVPIQP